MAEGRFRKRSGRRPPFVGRERELGVLRELLRSAGEGDGGVVLLAGEPGIGKTRLLTEFAASARVGGWLVLSGSAYETEGMPPYLPFAEAIRAYLRNVPDAELEHLVTAGKSELTLLLPELTDRFTDGVQPPVLSSEADRYHLFDRVSDFLLTAASNTESCGLLLCLDDLHWADRSTLLMLHHLARRLKHARLLVAGAYRTEEVDPARPFFSLLADFARERLDVRIMIQPLSEEQVGEFVRTTGIEFDAAGIHAVFAHTQGNPFYLEEVLHHLQAEDLVGPGLSGVDWSIPEGVRQVIGKRLLRLNSETLNLLQVGAVLGDGFQFEIAAAMSDIHEQVLMDALDQAIQAGLLREQGETCRFGHPLIQRTIYDGLTGARRRSLHLRAARTIEATYARHLEPYLSPLAVNYRLAGARAEPDKAVDYSVLAGTAAEKARAYEEACTHWQAALDLMERYRFEPRQRAELLARLGDLNQVMGFDSYAGSSRHFKQAIELYDEVSADEEAASVRARLGLLLGAGGPINDNGAALRYLHEAERHLEGSQRSEAQLWLYSGLGLVSVWQIRPEEGLRASSRAIEIASELGRHDRWCTNSIMCGYHLHALGRLGEGFDVMTRAWERADANDQTYPAYVAASWLGGRYADLGDPGSAESCYAREVGQKRQDEAPSRRRALWSATATAKAMSGQLDECRRILADEKIDGSPEVALLLGDWQRAESAWNQVRQAAPVREHYANLALASLSLANLARLRGDIDRSFQLLNEVLAIGLRGPHVILQLKASVELALVLCRIGRIDEAEGCLQRCREIIRQNEDWRGIAGRVALAEAAVAGAQGHVGEAEAWLAEAVHAFDRYHLPWDEADAYIACGTAFIRAGRPYRGKARESFERALEVYERLEAPEVWTNSLFAGLGRLLGASRHREVKPLPDGLTDREVEVLYLIANGESNRMIADELVLSLRTVERHITNIYAKIGARGRADATAYALRNSLT